MNYNEYCQLLAEKSAIEDFLEQIPEENKIERVGLESKKKELEEVLSSREGPLYEPVRARLTFTGKPVIGNQGIFADFGATIVSTFNDCVAAIGASQIESLGTRGSIPNKDDYRLMITSTALGSFGFELEEVPREEMPFPDMSLVKSAIEKIKLMLQASIGTDEDLSEAISEADNRALEKLHTFLETMAENDAMCSLEFNNEIFGFSGIDQVKRSEKRLRQDNIRESEDYLSGQFQGVLPKRRHFEFLDEESGEIIFGKVGQDIEDAGIINQMSDKTVTIHVRKKQVGKSTPRYLLLSYKEKNAS